MVVEKLDIHITKKKKKRERERERERDNLNKHFTLFTKIAQMDHRPKCKMTYDRTPRR